MTFKAVGSIIVGLMMVFLVASATETVDLGERVLVVGFGEIKETLGQGIHLVNPLYSMHVFTLRNNKYEAVASAATADIQKADIAVTINYDTVEDKIPEIYTKFGNDFISKVFAQNVQEAVKSASAKFTATELITKRDDFKAAVTDPLTGIRLRILAIQRRIEVLGSWK